jgi:predicted nucleotidyltransferase
MRRDEAPRLLAEHRDEIAGFGVSSLAVFGSVARDEAGADSDIDILVEFDPSAGRSLRVCSTSEVSEQCTGT